ncbi:MAG: permease [candidate division Zixibacteria bacterium]|nr:permease [candidate division Zixibacteria bacterium]
MSFNWKTEGRIFAILAGVFALFYFVPFDSERLTRSILEGLLLTQWYAREHVLLCLIPAFFIAGAIGAFVRQESVIRYLGPRAHKSLAYGVASISGSVLAVCSCTVLPLFAGIYRMGAGLGPATAFLYSGPAINVLAIILTARVLGIELGIARAVGAVVFSIVIGLLMHLFYRKEERERRAAAAVEPETQVHRPLWQTATFFGLQIAILVFATWSEADNQVGFWSAIGHAKWYLTSAAAIGLGVVLIRWLRATAWKVAVGSVVVVVMVIVAHQQPLIPFAVGLAALAWITATERGESEEWFGQSWGFAKQIMPLLLAGVLVAGFLLGRPGEEALIPSHWIASVVGGNGLGANLFAAVIGAFMYFATLTEVPILQGLIGSGMGKGPALALLLSGPALSLPSMLVIGQILGARKTIVYVTLVVVMSTLSGLVFGALA